MERFRTARNVAIVVALALAVDLLPGGGRAATTFEALLLIGFGVGFGYLGLRLYRENRVAIHGLGDRHRGALYGSLAAIAFVAVGRARMWQTTLGELTWFALVAAAIYGLMVVYRHWRTY